MKTLVTTLCLFSCLITISFAVQKTREYVSGIKWKEPKVITPVSEGRAPSDAIVLFNGENKDAFTGADKWNIVDGVLTSGKGTIRTKEKFGSCQIHLEFATPDVAKGKGQERGNSGIYIMGMYEVQILDSFNNTTYFDGQCASIYKQYPPLVNACRGPGEWQSYDIIFSAPEFNQDKTVKTPAYISVLHNGVLVQNHTELKGGTEYDKPPAYKAHPEKLPMNIQDHGNPMRFRNIWIREIVKMPALEEEAVTPVEGKSLEVKPDN
jgi:hypothetical protein